MRRVLPLCLAAMAVALFVSARLVADDQTETHEGKVVSVTGQKLIMIKKGENEEHSHTIVLEAKITLDGKVATLDDLKPGMRIKVTTPKGDSQTVTKIEAFKKARK